MPQSGAAAAEQQSGVGRAKCCGDRCRPGRAIGRAFIVVAVAGLIGVADSARRPIQLSLNPIEPTRVPTGGPGGVVAEAPATDIASTGDADPDLLGVRISLAQAKALYDSLGADFIDAREAHEFGPGHIPGAYNLTQGQFAGSTTPEVIEIMDPTRPVVIYCGGGNCHASENVAILLQQSGFTSIHIMVDGFPAWVAAGYEVEASADDEPEGGGP